MENKLDKLKQNKKNSSAPDRVQMDSCFSSYAEAKKIKQNEKEAPSREDWEGGASRPDWEGETNNQAESCPTGAQDTPALSRNIDAQRDAERIKILKKNERYNRDEEI